MRAHFFRSSVFLFLVLLTGYLKAQTRIEKDTVSEPKNHTFNSTRLKWVMTGHIVAYAGSLTGLSIMWYSKQPRGSFHFFNDDAEWLQVDKVGHLYSAYELSRTSHALWKWAGLPDKKAIWIGGLSGLAFQSIIEVLDGFSDEYGFSVGDYVTNVAGTTMFITQQLTWGDQRLKLKFSSHPRSYSEPDLKQRAEKIYGSSLPEKILKDYNHQTYWLSADIRSLFGGKKWPQWLNIAIGYGAEGMFGGMNNVAKDKNGDIIFDRSDLPRYRQWYLSPDLNFSKIKTRKKGVKVILFVLDAFKLPAPAIELSKGKLKGHWVYF